MICHLALPPFLPPPPPPPPYIVSNAPVIRLNLSPNNDKNNHNNNNDSNYNDNNQYWGDYHFQCT